MNDKKNYFVFREKCGKLRCLSNKRWAIAESEVIAWVDSQQDGRRIIQEIQQKESNPLFNIVTKP